MQSILYMEGDNMSTTNVFACNAKVTAKGQVTIPKDVREILGVGNGDRVTFIVNNGEARIVNSAEYAMKMLQEDMDGEAERTGIKTEQNVVDLVKSIRDEN